MSVLGYIAALNDRHILSQSIQGLRNQTYPVREIIVVDNGSVDGTQQLTLPERVTLICHRENRGTSGAVVTGFRYALAHGYEWMWVLDADSVPRKNALQELMRLYDSLPAESQKRLRLLGSLPVDSQTQQPHHGIVFKREGLRGFVEVDPDPKADCYECDSTMWSGSLFRMAAVERIGFPLEDYVLDWGDHEYGYRGRAAGYQAFMNQRSIIDHNLHPMPTMRTLRIGPLSLRVIASPPLRRYYFFRNFMHFWFHEYRREDPLAAVVPYAYLVKLLMQMVKIAAFNNAPGAELVACWRGMRDGLAGRVERKY